MATELAVMPDQKPVQVFTQDQVALIKRTIAKGATDDELRLFLNVCERTGLDPFARQIYCMKRWTDGVEKMSAEASIDGLRLCAERTGKYAGQLGPEWCGRDGQWRDIWLDDEPPAAARVGILRSDFKEPPWGKALYTEYVQTKKDGNPNRMWVKMAAGQLAKCAEALGLRKAFPRELSGVYTRDEMAQTSPEPEVQEQTAPEPQAQPDPEPFKMRDAFAGVKADLKKVTGTDELYYQILGAHGYEKSTQVPNRDEGTKVFRALKAAYATKLEEITQ